MKTIEVELVDNQTNATVLRLPERRFPGILIQGDSLAILATTLERTVAAIAAGRTEAAADEALEACELLRAYKNAYETAMRTAGLDLPYTG